MPSRTSVGFSEQPDKRHTIYGAYHEVNRHTINILCM